MRILLAAGLLALMPILAGCGGSDDPGTASATPTAATGVLAGSETGLAVGSTEAVPFDKSVAGQGAQQSLSTPTTVLGDHVVGDKVVAVEVTIESVTEVSLDDLDLDDESREMVEGGKVFQLRATIAYVNGPVVTMPNLNAFDLAANGENVTDDVSLFTGGSNDCGMEYEVQDFGKGAYLKTCLDLIMTKGNPDPTEVLWMSAAHTEAGLDQVSWPIS
jgi:hypothetical protein